jgi:hypothetical protein
MVLAQTSAFEADAIAGASIEALAADATETAVGRVYAVLPSRRATSRPRRQARPAGGWFLIPDFEALRRIALVFNVSLDHFLRDRPNGTKRRRRPTGSAARLRNSALSAAD